MSVDLCCALREGLIAGAALDVLSSEPIRSDSPVTENGGRRPPVHHAAHIAWASKEARTRLIRAGAEKILLQHLEGGMENRVV